jgi:hypothetical protein
MAKTQIEIQNEEHYSNIVTIMTINKLDCSNREKVINMALKIASDCVKHLEDEILLNCTNLKKTF